MASIAFPESTEDIVVADGAVVRAGGTDLQERLRSTNGCPDIVDLTRIAGFAGIERDEQGARIGAGTTVAVIGRELSVDYPALAQTALALATPQVRATGTVGGNLAQRTRCWYYRHPELSCFKSGSDNCPARTGRHLYGVAFDTSPCVHPHPSSLAMALLTYDATVTLTNGTTVNIAQLLGDGRDPTVDNQIPEGQVITAVSLPPPWDDERGAYFRAISRHRAEWPLVEGVVRISFDDDASIARCGLAIGGVAPVPLRLSEVETLLIGSPLSDEAIVAAARQATEGVQPLPETGYKVELIAATVTQVLEQVARIDRLQRSTGE